MATYLVAVRHAKPVSKGYSDDARPLSEEGRRGQKKVAQEMLQDERAFDCILTSPLVRAEQSAEILAKVFDASVTTEPALGNEFDADALLGKIPDTAMNQTICFVGHAPTLAVFVNKLVGKNVLPDGLSKASAVIIVFPDTIAYGQADFVQYYQG